MTVRTDRSYVVYYYRHASVTTSPLILTVLCRVAMLHAPHAHGRPLPEALWTTLFVHTTWPAALYTSTNIRRKSYRKYWNWYLPWGTLPWDTWDGCVHHLRIYGSRSFWGVWGSCSTSGLFACSFGMSDPCATPVAVRGGRRRPAARTWGRKVATSEVRRDRAMALDSRNSRPYPRSISCRCNSSTRPRRERRPVLAPVNAGEQLNIWHFGCGFGNVKRRDNSDLRAFYNSTRERARLKRLRRISRWSEKHSRTFSCSGFEVASWKFLNQRKISMWEIESEIES